MRVAALIVALLLAVAFAIQNTAAVNVSLGFWKAQASLAIVMALCIALGFLIGLLTVVPNYLKGRRHARNLERRLAKLDASGSEQSAPASASRTNDPPPTTSPARPQTPEAIDPWR